MQDIAQRGAEAIALEVHICDQRRSYVARFATEDQALAFVERKYADRSVSEYGNYAISEIESEPISLEASRLLTLMYPQCEHGLSQSNCYGPQHYYFDEEEQSRGMWNS